MFKPVKSFEGLYEVNEQAVIRSIERNGTKKGGRVLKHSTDSDGYKLVKMRNKKIIKTMKVHRVVAEAFIPNPLNKPQVNHKDHDKSNNHVDNLEWNTRTENIRHMFKSGLYKGNFGRVKVLQIDPLTNEVIKEYDSLKQAGKELNIDWQNISQVIRNYKGRKLAGGYHWKRSTTISKESTLEA